VNHLHCLLVALSLCSSTLLISQEDFTSTEAHAQYQQLTDLMAKSFPEDAYKTYHRSSFTPLQLETYLTQQFQRLDLLPNIENKHLFVMDAYLHSGNWFHEIGFVKQSIDSYKAFFKYYKEHKKYLTRDEINTYASMVSYAHSIMAENYAKINHLDSAALHHKQNISFNDTLSIISYPSAVNNFGLFYYWNKRDLDSALASFKRAYVITQELYPDHSLLGSIRDNIADVYTDQNKYSEALPLYADNFELYNSKHNEITGIRDIPRLISAGAQYVETNIRLNRIKEAQGIFFELDSIVKDAQKQKLLLPESKLEYLNTQEKLYKALNKLPLAYETLKLATAYSDSLAIAAAQQDEVWRNELNAVTIDRVALLFEIDRIEKENKIKSQSATLWISTLTSSVFIILLLSLYYGRRQHLMNAKNRQLVAEQKLENAALKMEQLNSEIQSKKRDLSDFAINLTQNQEWAKILADKIKMLKSANPEDRTDILEKLEQETRNKVQFDLDSKVFYERLDKLNDAFYTQLNTLFPNLSKNEIRLCSLIRIKMDSNNIATLQNITLASLNTSRYRMRKKMQLSDDVQLDDFIQHL